MKKLMIMGLLSLFVLSTATVNAQQDTTKQKKKSWSKKKSKKDTSQTQKDTTHTPTM